MYTIHVYSEHSTFLMINASTPGAAGEEPTGDFGGGNSALELMGTGACRGLPSGYVTISMENGYL